MIAIVDYDAGNLRSVEKALEYLGEKPLVTRDRQMILSADHVILPGVGAFGDAMEKLRQYELVGVLREAAGRGIPLFGICLGLQLLFEESEESPGVEGLGICRGRIWRIPDDRGRKVPHMGWNSLAYGDGGRQEISAENGNRGTVSAEEGNRREASAENGNRKEISAEERNRREACAAGAMQGNTNGRLFRGIPEHSYVYFVHSYYLKAEDPGIVTASTEYVTHIHASIEQGNVFACQFHPEKSGETGLAILKNFISVK